jgi:hypothetical protein
MYRYGRENGELDCRIPVQVQGRPCLHIGYGVIVWIAYRMQLCNVVVQLYRYARENGELDSRILWVTKFEVEVLIWGYPPPFCMCTVKL